MEDKPQFSKEEKIILPSAPFEDLEDLPPPPPAPPVPENTLKEPKLSVLQKEILRA